MEFALTEEQVAIRDSLDRWLGKQYGFEDRKKVVASDVGMSDAAWSTYAEMGLLALPIPEADGGLGGSGVDVGIVMAALGKALAVEPYLATVVLGAGLVALAGDDAQRASILPAVADGSLKLALAHQEPGSRHARYRVATRATKQGAGWTITGAKAMVLGAPQADRLIIVARTSGRDDEADGLSAFLVDRDASGVSSKACRNHDGQRAADVSLDGVIVDDGARLGPVGQLAPLLDAVLDRATAAVCEEAVGIMAALNDQTLAYLKTRKQFGVTIGSFQALQHRMADMVVALEQARSMATLASVKAWSADPAERARTVSAAKAYIGIQARHVGQEAVQMHGGMGLVDELIVSHWFRRLTLIEYAFGDTDHHFARFSASLLDTTDAAAAPSLKVANA